MSRSGCGPHSFTPNSNTPSCAKYDADAHRGGLRAIALERREPRDVVAGGQHAHVGAVLVLEAPCRSPTAMLKPDEPVS